MYVNRKHVHIINIQIICDANLVLTNVVARWPVSTHDSFILAHRSVGRRLKAGAVRDGWLLGKLTTYCIKCYLLTLLYNDYPLLPAGDSGYPLRRWLLTPFQNPQSAEQTHYTEAHTRARSVVERAIGLLKC